MTIKLVPLATLMPHVEKTDDILRYRVASRSRKRKHLVDLEARGGLGRCTCEDHEINKNADCYHLTQARKALAIEVAQGTILRRNGSK